MSRSRRQLRGGDMSTQPRTIPKTIETLADAVYPSFAMLAGMELDLFTPLKDGPLTADEIVRAAGTDRAKSAPLLHALVAIGLLKSDGDCFLNSPEADQFLVRGSPDYIGMRHYAYRRRWNSVLCVAERASRKPAASAAPYAQAPAVRATNDAMSRRPPYQRGTTALSGRTPGRSDASIDGGRPPGHRRQRRAPENPTWRCRDRMS